MSTSDNGSRRQYIYDLPSNEGFDGNHCGHVEAYALCNGPSWSHNQIDEDGIIPHANDWILLSMAIYTITFTLNTYIYNKINMNNYKAYIIAFQNLASCGSIMQMPLISEGLP